MIRHRVYGGRALRIAVGIMMLALLLAAQARATITVNTSDGEDYTRIQDVKR